MLTIKVVFQLLQNTLLTIRNKCDFRSIPSEWSQGTQGQVLFIQGFNGNIHSFFTLAQLANQLGYQIHFCQKLGRNTMPISQAADIVKRFILTHSSNKLVIIGHSKGGLIARMLTIDPDLINKIKCIITIASPHNGTMMGWLVPSGWELTKTNGIIKQLADEDNHKVPIYNLYPKLDNMVIPNQNLYLKGAINHQIEVVGHTQILESTQTQTVIDEILSKYATK